MSTRFDLWGLWEPWQAGKQSGFTFSNQHLYHVGVAEVQGGAETAGASNGVSWKI